MIKKLVSSILVILHILTFGYVADGLSALASSANYKLDAATYSQGGSNKGSSSYKIALDSIGQACAGETGSSTYKFKTGYVYTAQSNPPELKQAIPNFSWKKNESRLDAFCLDDYFTGDCGSALTYTYSGNTQINISIDTSTHKVSFSQPASWFGTETVRCTATDSDSNSVASNNISLQVEDVQNPPVLDFIPDITVDETQLVKVMPHATDADGDAITYSYSPPLNSSGEWQTDYTSSGTYMAAVTATDATGLKDTKNVNITVRNVNRPPVITAINEVPVTQGQPLTIPDVNENTILQITPTASDPDNETVIFYYSSPLDSTGKWLIDYEQAGLRTITVTASDGIATVVQEVRVNVINVNRAPVSALTLSKYTVAPNEDFTITLNAQDPDGDAMTYVLKKDGIQFASGAISNSITQTTSFAGIGDHTIQAVVIDSGGLQASLQAAVDIYDPNANRDAINPVMGDFNGDGLSDLGLHNSDTGTWEICLSDKGVFNAAVDWLTGFGTSKDWWPVGGDFNADGKTDIGIYNNTTGELRVALSDGIKFTISGTWFTVSGASYNIIPFTGNFNGDKYTDFGVYNKDTGEWRIALGTGSGFGNLTTWLSGFGGPDYSPLTGDFNGDGLTDIAIFNKSSGEIKIALSNNRGFIIAKNGNPWISNFAVNQDLLTADFNNDGLTDAGYFDKSGDCKWREALNTSTGFTDNGIWLSGFGSSSITSAHTGDFNGDGLTDAATFDKNQNGIDKWAVKLSTKKPTDLLTEIDNGIGGKTYVMYTYISNVGLPFPVYVASSISSANTVPADRAATYTQNFTFEDGWFDATEREFRGFRKVKVTDPITGNYTETYFFQGNPARNEDGALKGQIEKILAYDGNGKLISKAINKWNVRKGGPADGVLGFPYLEEVTQTVNEENELSITTKNQFTYDNLGNIIKEVCLGKFNPGDPSTIGDEKSTETKYSYSYEQGHNRPLEISLKDKDGNLVNKKVFEYDPNGNVTKETACLDGSNDPTTEYDYDSFGNVCHTTNAEQHVVTTDYETAFYTYPKTITNELGHQIKYEYNPKFGVLTKLTDVNGKVTETVYDTLARITAQKNTQGQTVTAYEYPDFNTKIARQYPTPNPQPCLTKTEYIDGLGRPYKTVSDGEDGAAKRQVSNEVYFNNRGLKDFETLPHYIDIDPLDNTQVSYIKYTYDLRGRVKTTTSDFPGVTKDAASSINYISPLYTETTDPRGLRKGIQKDVYGNTMEIIEFIQAGTYHTYYEYDLKGNLIKLTDAQGNITQIQYDRLGRKIQLNDPDTGITTYTYDKLGNLKTQTDNKGNVITMEYDQLSRLTKKSAVSGPQTTDLAVYEYDDASKPNCLGRLSKVMAYNTVLSTVDYYYDTEGRAVKVEKTIDGTTYTTETACDQIGRTTSIKYPDGEVIDYEYDTNSGLLEKVHNATNSINAINSINYNAKGQIRSIKYGNNVETTYTYGQDLRLSRILTTDNRQLTTFQDLNYDFNKNGNIIQLTNNLRSNIRAYTYDDLNRLTRAENTPDPLGGYTTFEYQYDSIGNMTYKSDVGFLTYNPTAPPITQQGHAPPLPHAVTKAGSNNYTYDLNGNMLSAPNKLMAYDCENRMVSLETSTETTQFTYDVDGSRIKKITATETEIYVSGLYEIKVRGQQARIIKHIFAGANRVCTVDSAEGVHYFHSDHLGSSNVITDGSGAQVSLTEYTPYGTPIVDPSSSFSTPYKFTGKELDSTGLYFYAWRYYDPQIGRFCQPDTIIPEPYNPQTLNRYSYCDNNPLNYTDPSGHKSVLDYWNDFCDSISNVINEAIGWLEDRLGVEITVDVQVGGSVPFGPGGNGGGSSGGGSGGSGSYDTSYAYDESGMYNPVFNRVPEAFTEPVTDFYTGSASIDSYDPLQLPSLTYSDLGRQDIVSQINAGAAAIKAGNLGGALDIIGPYNMMIRAIAASERSNKAWWPKWFSKYFEVEYGNYGGSNRTDKSFKKVPIDQMDFYFKQHDIRWLTGHGSKADIILYQQLSHLAKDPTKWHPAAPDPIAASVYRAGAQTYFKSRFDKFTIKEE